MSQKLEIFPNQYPGREYEVNITCPEFTAVCPRTGQPDFATIRITYVPDESIIELKSLKLYMFSYRDKGIFHEHVTNQILDDIVEAVRYLIAAKSVTGHTMIVDGGQHLWPLKRDVQFEVN